jgi:hypothetical protein
LIPVEKGFSRRAAVALVGTDPALNIHALFLRLSSQGQPVKSRINVPFTGRPPKLAHKPTLKGTLSLLAISFIRHCITSLHRAHCVAAQ